MANQVSSDVEVVMIPLPAQSHLNNLLQLSHIISSYNIKIHYVASAIHISQAKSRAIDNPTNSNNNNIEFHSLKTPEFSSPPPSNPTFPTQLIPSFEATEHLRDPVRDLLLFLSEKTTRLVVILDTTMSHVVNIEFLTNVELYFFNCLSPTYRLSLTPGFDLGALIGVRIPSFEGIFHPDFLRFLDRQARFRKTNKKSGILDNTCRVLEDRTLDVLMEKERENDKDLKIWAIAPMMVKPLKASLRHKCLEWLDKQERNSVLYVSFGTTSFMEDDQIEELAKGLEESGTKFIWVLREADKVNIFEKSEARRYKLPLRFEERINEMRIGMIARDWVPQLEILGHSSTGGFVSHCGWNSCLESLTLGVPLAAWPMHSDQPINAFLVTQILEAGFVLRDWEKRDELVSSSTIGEVVKRLMSSVEGKKVREKANELGYELRKCTQEGGASRLELDSFITHITRTN